jgi:hypothetical protein
MVFMLDSVIILSFLSVFYGLVKGNAMDVAEVFRTSLMGKERKANFKLAMTRRRIFGHLFCKNPSPSPA